jgi:hypothetical protein
MRGVPGAACRSSSALISSIAIGFVVMALVALSGASARAQEDLDQGKSGSQLFAASCVNCHHSPRGLAKDRFSLTLWLYLRQHYTSSSASAQTLAAYLQSVDAPRGKPQPTTAAAKSKATVTTASEPGLRPPASVPGR